MPVAQAELEPFQEILQGTVSKKGRAKLDGGVVIDYDNEQVITPSYSGLSTFTKTFDDVRFEDMQSRLQPITTNMDTKFDALQTLIDSGESGLSEEEIAQIKQYQTEYQEIKADYAPNTDIGQGLLNVGENIGKGFEGFGKQFGEIGEAIGEKPLETAGNFFSGLTGEIGKAFTHPIEFIDTIAYQTKDLIGREIPENLIQAVHDTVAAFTNTPGTGEFDIQQSDQKQPLSGRTGKELQARNPLAAIIPYFAAFAIPSLTVDGLIGEGLAGAGSITRNLAKIAGVATADTIATPAILGSDADTVEDRMSENVTEAINTFLLSAGIEGGIIGLKKMFKQKVFTKVAEDMPLEEADKAARVEVAQEIQQSLDDVTSGKKDLLPEVKQSLLDMDAAAPVQAQGKVAETVTPAPVKGKPKPKQKINTKTLATGERKTELQAILKKREPIQAKVEVAAKEAEETIEITKREIQNAEAENAKQLQTEYKIDPIEAEYTAHIDEVTDTDTMLTGVYLDGMYARMGGVAGLNRLKGQTPRLTGVIDNFVTSTGWKASIVRKANKRATWIYENTVKKLGVKDVKELDKKYLRSGLYRAWKEKLDTKNMTHPEFGEMREFVKKYRTSGTEPRGEYNKELNKIFTDKVLAERGIKASAYKTLPEYYQAVANFLAKDSGTKVNVVFNPKLKAGAKNAEELDTLFGKTTANVTKDTRPGYEGEYLVLMREPKPGDELLILHEVQHAIDMDAGFKRGHKTDFKKKVRHFQDYNDFDFAAERVFQYLTGSEKSQPFSLTAQEIAGFEWLDKQVQAYNKGINIKLMGKVLGEDVADSLLADAFTDSQRGRKIITITDPEVVTELKRAGHNSVKLGPTKENPAIPDQEFIIFGYGDSLKEVLDSVDEGRYFYEGKYPELFEGGVLKRGVFAERHNFARDFSVLEKSRELLPEQVQQVYRNLRGQGYDVPTAEEITKLISSGNTDLTSVKKQLRKVFVGSLQKRKGLKLSANLDPINALRQQNIQLAKKVFRDEMNPILDKMTENVIKVKEAKNGVLTDKQVYALNREQHIISEISNMVNNRPGFFEGAFLAAAQATGKDADWVFKNMRNATDQYLGVEANLKLAYNVAASVANVVEAMRVVAPDVPDLPLSKWNQLLSKTKTPTKLVQETRRKMMKSPNKSFYLDRGFDASIDSIFTGKKNISSGVTDSGLFKVGMVPFSNSIEFGKIWVYNVAEQIGKHKGLAGKELDDFIFDFMSDRSQIQALNVAPTIQNDSVLKSLVFLKNFIFRTTEMEVDAWRRTLGSVTKGKVDRQAVNRVLYFSTVPAILLGVGTSPGLMLANSLISGTTGVMSFVSGGLIPTVDVYKQMQSGKQDALGQIGKALTSGVFGSVTGISTKQMTIDPLNALGQKPMMLSTMDNLGAFASDLVMGAQLGMDMGDAGYWGYSSLKAVDKLAKSEMVGYARANKASSALLRGEIKSNNGTPMDVNIPEEERPYKAAFALAGFNTVQADENYARMNVIKTDEKQKELLKKEFVDRIADLIITGQTTKAKQLVKSVNEKGYGITEKTIINRVTTKKIDPLKNKLRQSSKAEQRDIIDKYPDILEDDTDDVEDDAEDADIE